MEILIENKKIGPNHRPFLIAEMSGNHNNSLDRALKIVDAAADAGVDAIKLQTFTPDTMTLNIKGGLFEINDINSLWNGRTLYDLYQEAQTPWDWHKAIFNRAKERGLIPFSTPFDESAVDFLESLSVPIYKIASYENTDWTLLKKIAQTKKPVLMSTGVSDLSQIWEAVNILKNNGCPSVILLKCTSTYPSSPKDSNILTIPHMIDLFNCIVGLSDHTLGIGAAVASVALGSRVIEKHFTINRSDGGIDSAFSMEPGEMKMLVSESINAFLALGNIQYNVQKNEEKGRQFKRSIYAVKLIDKGDTFTKDNIKVIRPGDGLEPKYYDMLIGRKAKTDIPFATPLTWDLLI